MADVGSSYQHIIMCTCQRNLLPFMDEVLTECMQEEDGRAFLVRSVNNDFVGISQLTDDYTNTTGLVSIAPRVSIPDITQQIISLMCHERSKRQ